MNYWTIALALAAGLSGCSSLKKDNEPKPPPNHSEGITEQLAVYQPLVKASLDPYGLARMGGSVGDSALFSCLARVGGGADFDPAVLFVNGQPLRHPDIAPGVSRTPISKDMVNGILWCLWDVGRKGDKPHALTLSQEMISFGRQHQDKVAGWLFCTEEDRAAYQISSADWVGKCLMPPSTIKDIYRVHKWLGGDCDDDCRYWTDLGVNLPGGGKGFERHLAVLTTSRNGLVDGAINDNSLDQLRKAAEAQPRNGLFLAAYHLFGDGNQEGAFTALMDSGLFPKDHLPTAENYCSQYLFQRDQDEKDWAPCGADGGSDGRGIEWIFAASLALGQVSK